MVSPVERFTASRYVEFETRLPSDASASGETRLGQAGTSSVCPKATFLQVIQRNPVNGFRREFAVGDNEEPIRLFAVFAFRHASICVGANGGFRGSDHASTVGPL